MGGVLFSIYGIKIYRYVKYFEVPILSILCGLSYLKTIIHQFTLCFYGWAAT